MRLFIIFVNKYRANYLIIRFFKPMYWRLWCFAFKYNLAGYFQKSV